MGKKAADQKGKKLPQPKASELSDGQQLAEVTRANAEDGEQPNEESGLPDGPDPHTVTTEDLEGNPGLVEAGVVVGDVIGIPKNAPGIPTFTLSGHDPASFRAMIELSKHKDSYEIEGFAEALREFELFEEAIR